MRSASETTSPFRELVADLNRGGISDAYHAALSMLADVQRGSSPQQNQSTILESRLRFVLEETRKCLPEILDWVSLSETARRRGEATLTPDIAQLIVDLVKEGEYSRAIVLQDPLCLVAARLAYAGVSVEQYCSGSDTPKRCAEIADTSAWKFLGAGSYYQPAERDRANLDSGLNKLAPFSESPTSTANGGVAIAAFPLIPGVSGGAHSKQLPYAAVEDLLAVLSAFGPSISQLIALVPSSMLYRSGKAKEFRNDLLASGTVEAILELPNGVTPLATHPYSVLMLRRPQSIPADDAVFVMTLPERATLATRGRGRRVEVESSKSLAQRIVDGSIDAKSNANRIVTLEDIRRSGSLLPRMLLGDLTLDSSTATNDAQLLDLVQIVRPTTLPKGMRRPRIGVTTASIAQAFPYIAWAETTHDCSDVQDAFKAHETAAPLEQGDLVMVVRGSVGAMGLVDAPTDGPVFVPNSCFVLRPKAGVSGEALYLFFKSPLGKERLQSSVTGSTVRNIRIADLGSLVVPVPSERTSAIAIETLRNICRTTSAIRRLEDERALLMTKAIGAAFEQA